MSVCHLADYLTIIGNYLKTVTDQCICTARNGPRNIPVYCRDEFDYKNTPICTFGHHPAMPVPLPTAR